MVSAQKQWLFIFLTILLSITVAIPVHAQTATPPMPRDVLLGAITEQAQRDEQKGIQESTEGLNLLFGEQAKQLGMSLPEVKKIYEDAYRAAAGERPWYVDLTKDWLPNLGWIAALIALLAAIFRGAIEDAGKKLVSSLGEALYSRFAGHKPFWMLALRRYKAALYEKHHELKLPFRPGRPLEMKEVYVPVKVSGKGAQSADTLTDAYQAIEKHKKLVVLGAPGAGKSILLRHVALTYAERDLNEPLVPVLVELNRLNDAGTKMFDHLAALLKQNDFPNGENFLKAWLKTGQLLLMFDGLDEVNTDRREQVSAGIRDLLAEYPGCHAIVTCRTQVYKGEFADWADQTLEVAEFSDQQIQRFLFAWQKELPSGKSVEHLWANLSERPRILALARNPLMLTIIAFLYADTEFVLPHSRAEFYDTAVTVLLEQWKEKRNRYKAASKRLVMQHLALFMQDTAAERGQERRTIDLPTLLAEIKKILPSLMLKDADAQSLLDEIIERSGLIIGLERGQRYQFTHLTLQEFFAARSLGDDAPGLLERFKADPDAWRETVKLWCGLEHDSTQLLTEIYQIDSATTYECLPEAQKISPALYDQMIEKFKTRIGAGETDETILKAVAVVLADPRGRGQKLFEFLKLVVSSDKTNFKQKFAAARILAFTNLSISVKVLVELAKTSAKANKVIYPLLIQMGDTAIPELQEMANSGMLGALNILYQIGTPRAAQSLASLLWNDDSDLSYQAAWRLSTLLSHPEIEASLRFLVLSAEQRKSAQLEWIWKPFGEPTNSALPNIAGRLAYLLQNSPVESIPAIQLMDVDARLSIPLCLVAAQEGRLNKRIRHSSHADEILKNLLEFFPNVRQDDTQDHQSQLEFLKKNIPFISDHIVWRRLLNTLRTPLQFDIVRCLLEKREPDNDDWLQIFRPMHYDFDTSWHGYAMKTLLLLIITSNILILLGNILVVGATTWGWENAVQLLAGILSLIAAMYFFRKKLGDGWRVTLLLILNFSAALIVGNLASNWWFGILIGLLGNPFLWGATPGSLKKGAVLLFGAVILVSGGYSLMIMIGLWLASWAGMFTAMAVFLSILFTLGAIIENLKGIFVGIVVLVLSIIFGFLSIYTMYNPSHFIFNIGGLLGLLIFWILWVLMFGFIVSRSLYMKRRSENPLYNFVKYLPNAPKQMKPKRPWIFDILPFRGINR